MRFRPTRRSLFAPGVSAAALALVGRSVALAGDVSAEIATVEQATGGCIGVAALDPRTGRRLGIRADERFPMCSTFKLLAAAFALARAENGEDHLERLVPFAAGDLVTYSPATGPRAGQGMTLAELCAAALVLSDNTAGNLLLASFGGPTGLTGYVRSLGDPVTRLDRIETELNEARPGDPRDTTTPAAMLETLRRIVLGDALAPRSRDMLVGWMRESRTGNARLKAGLPGTWVVADKTGTGENGTANDVAVAWRPDGSPLLIAVFITGATADAARLNAAHAEVAGKVATFMA